MKRLIAGLFTALWLLVPGWAAEPLQELGPWKIGMTRTEAESFEIYGPYSVEKSTSVVSQTISTPPKFPFLGELAVVRLRLVNSRLNRIQVDVLTTPNENHAGMTLRKCLDYFRKSLGQSGDAFDVQDAVHYLEKYMKPLSSGSTGPVFGRAIEGHPYLRAEIGKAPQSPESKTRRISYVCRCIIEDAGSNDSRVPITQQPSAPIDPNLKARALQDFGPWKIGMSRADVEAVSEHGPYLYKEESPSDSSPACLTSSETVEFLGAKVSVALYLKGGSVSMIQIRSLQTEDEGQAADIYLKTFGYFLDRLGRSNPSSGQSREEVLDQLEKSAGVRLYVVGHPYLGVRIEKKVLEPAGTSPGNQSQKYLYSCFGEISAVDPTGPPAEIAPKSAALADWSFEVPGGDAKFKRSLGSIHALLVRPLDGGGHAAQAMKLNVTAVPITGDGALSFSFNQPIGEEMRRASEEVVRGIQVSRGILPRNMSVKFGFEDKWGGKDGPSASVACALLLDSLILGFEIPQDFAVTGDMNADLSVQPVGGVGDKLRGAMDAGCFLVGIPAANEEDLNDVVGEENLRRFLNSKVFLLRKLEDALVLADPGSRTAGFNQALADFDGLQKELREKGAALLYAAATQQRLDTILKTLPNLYSAKILSLASLKKTPSKYSLVGSLVRIEQSMAPYVDAARSLRAGKSIEKLRVKRDNPLLEARNKLTALKSKSDPRLLEMIQAQENVIQRTHRLIDPISTADIKELLEELQDACIRAETQRKKLSSDREIQDQLMKRGISY